VQIDRTIGRAFPKLAAWIASEIPACRSDARIWPAFVKYSQLGEDGAARALEMGSPPTIDAARMGSLYGYFDPTKKRKADKVFVSRSLCKGFESPDADMRTMKPYDLIMKASILHEMVHWADHQDGHTQPDADRLDPMTNEMMRGIDVGFQFELEAFHAIYTREFL
jgi:hypothetical protein